MKTLTLLLALSLLSMNVFSQKDAAIVAAMRNKPSLTTAATEIEIANMPISASGIMIHGEDRDVEKQIKHYFEDKLGVDLKKNKGILQKSGLSIPAMHPDTLSLFLELKENNTGVDLAIAAGSGNTFLSPQTHPKAFLFMDSILIDFSKIFYAKSYHDKLADERKALEKLNKELSHDQSQLGSLGKSISSTSGKIKSDELGVEKAKNATRTADSSIETLESDKSGKTKALQEVILAMDQRKLVMDPLQSQINTKAIAGETESKEYKKQSKALSKLRKSDAAQLKQKEKLSSSITKLDSQLIKRRTSKNKAESTQRDLETRIMSHKNEQAKLEGNIRDTEKNIKNLEEMIKEKGRLITDLELSAAALGLKP